MVRFCRMIRRIWVKGVALMFASLAFSARATVHYVDATSANPSPPFTNWQTAAITIQDAVDVCSDGDQVLVTNGVYATGGRIAETTLTNRVAVTNSITLQSVTGPASTIIVGFQVPGTTNGATAVRCV